MSETRSMGDAFNRAIDAPGNLVASIGASIPDLFLGKNPIDGIRAQTRQSFVDLAGLPWRLFWHGSKAAIVGGAKLALNGIAHLPIIPISRMENTQTFADTRRSLGTLQNQMKLSGGQSPKDSGSLAA